MTLDEKSKIEKQMKSLEWEVWRICKTDPPKEQD
jgi:hypothetical protein